MIHTDGKPTIANGAGDELFSVIVKAVEDGERDALTIPPLTEWPVGSLPVFGDELPNGATVIEAKNTHGSAVVLARTSREYVTWSMRYRDRACFSGHYHDTLKQAVVDYELRT